MQSKNNVIIISFIFLKQINNKKTGNAFVSLSNMLVGLQDNYSARALLLLTTDECSPIIYFHKF